MRIDILTLFPRMFGGPLDESLLGKAKERGLLNVQIHDIRDYTEGKHRQADDSPYGGGAGMVMKPEPIAKAIEEIKGQACLPDRQGSGVKGKGSRVILMSPAGRLLTQEKAIELSKEDHLVIICGHYEGIDERVLQSFAVSEISIGDYVLTGGELPAMVMIDAIARHIPGIVKEEESVQRDSFYNGLLDHPSFTRPEEFKGIKVPEVLLSGDHKKIEAWRRKQSLKKTLRNRPDLLSKAELSLSDKALLKEIITEG
jgi:tRNA (guanine37-N1)-methyltransferase